MINTSMKDSQINPYEHSDIKVKLLKLYLEKYISILALAKGVNEVLVHDLFCGEGIYDNNKEGSPVIILKLIKEKLLGLLAQTVQAKLLFLK